MRIIKMIIVNEPVIIALFCLLSLGPIFIHHFIVNVRPYLHEIDRQDRQQEQEQDD